MLTKTSAIVIRSMKYGESKMIIDLLTQTEGRVSVIVNVPQSSKGRVKKQFFQPMTILDVELDIRPKAQLQKLRDVRIAVPYMSLTTDPRKLSVALFLAEFLYYATRGERDNPLLFGYISSGLQWLDTCTEQFANFHLVFMMRLSRFVGFYPNLEGYVPGAFFDLEASSFTSLPPLHANFLSAADSALVVTLMRMTFDTMHLFRFSRDERNRFTEVILTYYRLHVPAFPELRSLPVLQQLF